MMDTQIQKSVFSLLMLLSTIVYSQEDTSDAKSEKSSSLINAYVSVHGFLSQDGDNPFWMYTNTNNTIAKESNYSIRTGLHKLWKVSENGYLTLGGGLNARDGVDKDLQIEELYGSYTQKWFNITAGVKHRDVLHDGLSTINGDILWTGNARSVPGIQIKTQEPIAINSWLSFKAALAHYELNDDRYVDNARIHNKSLAFIIKTAENQKLTAGLSHYVQWGGTSPETGKQAGSFKDFVRLFFGQNGGSTFNDQINALGNHLGSYQLNYNINLETKEIDIYYQSLFEDRSGRELNNFPDGVWGVAVKLKDENIFNTFLIEYIQTVSQSGRPRTVTGGNQQSGADNYFGNSIYRSGWTYQGNIIGLPFIIRNSINSFTISNRSSGFQLGAAGSYQRFDYKLKTTIIKNLGTYGMPFESSEKAIYTHANVSYGSKIGAFNLQLGLDVSNLANTTFGAGLGYSYNWN